MENKFQKEELPCITLKDNEDIINIMEDREVRGSIQRDGKIE